MTSTGIFILRMVCMKASFHCVALNLSARPESTAATKTPVPAADNQLIVNRAASAFALTGTTGGIRCTRLCSAGMSHTGSDNDPLSGEPRTAVLIVTPPSALFNVVFHAGDPHSAQQRIKIGQGVQAWMV